MTFHVPEKFRVTRGPQASSPAFGCNGAFVFAPAPGRPRLFVIASDADGWEHVSVSTTFRCPTWDEMCWIKSQFWDDEDCVVQFHPARSEYVNVHQFCLHLWRPVGTQRTPLYEHPQPPSTQAEPVAWRITDGEGGYDYRDAPPEDWQVAWVARWGRKHEPLYTQPHPQPPSAQNARPLSEWHEDDGPVVWWLFPVHEPAWIGTPLDTDWPGYHTHWTPHPAAPATLAETSR